MFIKKDEDFAQFRDLTEIMEKAEQKKTSDNFTYNVITRLSEEKSFLQSFSIR
jgi:hypothetical protein